MAYCTLAEVRALDVLAARPDVYPDGAIVEGIAWATATIDEETGTAWEPATRSVTVTGSGSDTQFVDVIHLRTVTACTVDGVAQVVTGWRVTDLGQVVRTDDLTFTAGAVVVLTVTAAKTATAPADIAWAARTLARWYVLNLFSQAPQGAQRMTTDMGTVEFVNLGPGRYATSLPEVNAVLRRRDHRRPGWG